MTGFMNLLTTITATRLQGNCITHGLGCYLYELYFIFWLELLRRYFLVYLLTPSRHQEPIKQDIRATHLNSTQKAKSKNSGGFPRKKLLTFFFSSYSMLKTVPHAKSHRRKHNREKMQVERIPKPKKRKAQARNKKIEKTNDQYLTQKQKKAKILIRNHKNTRRKQEPVRKKKTRYHVQQKLLPQSISIETVITPL